MSYFQQFHLLICTHAILFCLLVAGDQRTADVDLAKPIFDMNDHTELRAKKKNAVLDLMNNNILRDRNSHLPTENSKSILGDLIRNSPMNLEYESKDISNTLNKSNTASVNVEYGTKDISNSTINHGASVLPRNTRDLILGSSLSNNTNVQTDNSTITSSKPNTSLNAVNEILQSTTSVPLPYNVSTTSNETVSDEVDITTTTLLPTVVKNPKDKENKTKPEMNSKQFKKPSINMKNKPNVITNASLEAIKPENITEYSTEQPVNDTISNNGTNFVSMDNGTSKYNASVSSLQTIPELEGLQPMGIVLIVVVAVALISIITAIGMFSVVLYRRYRWNKPQTFSDKCSNADSTGYIDDSTLKETSEEMYSLDNDSFLNSLEAMTIQNYWADSIRHTKL